MADEQHVLTDTKVRSPRWLLVSAMLLTGLSMRTAVTSVGPVLGDIETGLRISTGMAGVITTLPVLCFAAIGTTAPRLSHRYGEHLLLVCAMGLMTIGLLGRAVAGSIWLFIVFSVLALTGGAISNVLMPSLVKRHFPDQIGRMTAAYTTAMSIGMTAAVGFTAPISDRAGADGWRVGLGCWAVLSVLAMLPWLPTLRGDRPDEAAPPRLPLWRLLGSRTAWALTLLFATQSLQAYVAFGWFPTYLRDHGMTAAQAGLLVAFYSALAIPTSMVMPTLAPRGQRRLVLVLVSCYAVSYVGLALVPVGGAWLWMLLAGTASGLFPLALTLFGLRTRTPQSTAAVAAFTQGIGYLLAASGPFLVGITVGRPHDWTGMFVLLFAALAVCLVAGLRASRPTYVDDELGQG